MWQYRRLLGFIGDRALRKMYRRTVLGWLWLFINPLFPIALRAIIFGGLLGVGSNGLPYFLFLLAGTVVWDVFATSLMWGTRALEMNRDLTDQIYHPRAILPFGNMTPALLNLALKVGVFAARASSIYTRAGRPDVPARAIVDCCGPVAALARGVSLRAGHLASSRRSGARRCATSASGSASCCRCGTS